MVEITVATEEFSGHSWAVIGGLGHVTQTRKRLCFATPRNADQSLINYMGCYDHYSWDSWSDGFGISVATISIHQMGELGEECLNPRLATIFYTIMLQLLEVPLMQNYVECLADVEHYNINLIASFIHGAA